METQRYCAGMTSCDLFVEKGQSREGFWTAKRKREERDANLSAISIIGCALCVAVAMVLQAARGHGNQEGTFVEPSKDRSALHHP